MGKPEVCIGGYFLIFLRFPGTGLVVVCSTSYISLAVIQSHGHVYLQGTGSMAVTWEEEDRLW